MQDVKTPWAPFMGQAPMHIDYFQGTMVEAVERMGEKCAGFDAYEFMGSRASYAKLVEQIHSCARALKAVRSQFSRVISVSYPL